MIKIENQCVGCETCMPYCSKREVKVLICDDCGDECQELYYGTDGQEVCNVCLKHHVDKVVVE
jgi:hypothetical protein